MLCAIITVQNAINFQRRIYMKAAKKIVSLLLAVLMAFSMVTVSLTAFAATKKVTKVKLNKTKATVYVSETVTLKATVSPSKATNKSIKWSTSNKSVATVSSKGVVKGVKAGTATITAAAKDGSGKKATCKITVKNIAVSKVALNKTSATVSTGSSLTLKATVSPSNATNKSIKWSTSNKNVATVSTKGVVKGVKAGTATITAAAQDGSGKKATCKITVKNVSVSSISLNKTSLTVYPAGTYTLKATVSPSNATDKAVKWTSSDTTAATVSSTGVVKGIKEGKTATITCTAADGSGKKATCKVTVGVKAKQLSVTYANAGISSWYVGKTDKLSVSVTPSNTTNKAVKWTSSEPECVTVDSNGNVKVVKNTKVVQEKTLFGTRNKTVKVESAVITATASDGSGVKGNYTVNINDYKKIDSVAFVQTLPDIMYVNQKTAFAVAFTPVDASERAVTYSTSNSNIATVDAKGNVTALKAGTVTITATATKDTTKKVSKTIEIKEPTFKMYVSRKTFYAAGDSQTVILNSTPDDAFTNLGVHFESENSKIADATQAKNYPQLATINFKAPGKTRIHAVTSSGKPVIDEEVGEWINIEVRDIRAAKDYFEEVSGGDMIPVEVYLYNGARVSEAQPDSGVEYIAAKNPFDEYFGVTDDGDGKFNIVIQKDLPSTGAYIVFKAGYAGVSLEKKIYFTPGKYTLPSGTQTQLLGTVKTYSQRVSGLTSANCAKTIDYTDTVVDTKKSKSEMTVTVPILGEMSLDGFLDWYESKSGGSVSGGEETEELLDEMSPEKMIKDLFTGTQEESKSIGNSEAPQAITVDAADVKSVEVIDNGSSTYQFKLTLKDMTGAIALDAVKTSAYGKTMKVIDKAYIENYKNSLNISGSQDFGEDAKTSMTYGAINQKYTGGYVIMTVDKLTDKVTECENHYKSNIKVDNATFSLAATISLSDSKDSILNILGNITLGIKLTAYFTMNVDTTTRYTAINY